MEKLETLEKKETKEERLDREGKIGAKRMVFWQSREISTGCNMLTLGFLSIYCTDTLKVPAATVGILLMVSKIIDAVTDIFAGYFVDKTNTKIGRGRPYELCILGVWLCTWLLFSCPPEFSMAAKCAWILAMYAFINSIFVTFLYANRPVYMVRAFPRQEQYVALSSYGSIITMLAVIAFNVSFPMAMAKIAVSAKGWSALLAIYGIPLTLIGLLRFIFIKETNKVDIAAGEKLRVRDVLLVLKNPYIYIVALMTLVYNFITNMGSQTYYFTYIVGDIGMLGPLALTQIILVPVVFIFPPFIKKYSTSRLITVGLALLMTGYLVNFLAKGSFPLLVLGSLFTGLGAIPISMLTTLLIIDCAEFNEWKKRPRMEGTLSSLNGFASKAGAAFGAGVLGLLLTASGYTGSAETMPAAALTMIRLLYSLVPMGLYVLVIIALQFYKLDKLMPQIRKENEEARSAAHQRG
jgi:probable glucitol transport protein GutA